MIPAPPGYAGRPPGEWPVPEMDHEAGGKASAYTPQMGRLILARIAAGETVKQVTADPRMPSYATVYRWVRVHEDFAEAWTDVRWALAEAAIVADAQAQADRASLRAFKTGVGWARRRGGGRRSTYNRGKGLAVCRQVAAGAPVSHVLDRPGMPSTKAFYGWLKTRPGLRRAYHAACLARMDALQLDLWFAADQVLADGDLARAKAEVAAIEGRMGRLTPKKYRALP